MPHQSNNSAGFCPPTNNITAQDNHVPQFHQEESFGWRSLQVSSCFLAEPFVVSPPRDVLIKRLRCHFGDRQGTNMRIELLVFCPFHCLLR
jgi:hypothetical protein